METLGIFAQNIKCIGCANNIKTGLADITGIERVEVDIETGKVSIFGAGIQKNIITEKIAILGYPEQ